MRKLRSIVGVASCSMLMGETYGDDEQIKSNVLRKRQIVPLKDKTNIRQPEKRILGLFNQPENEAITDSFLDEDLENAGVELLMSSSSRLTPEVLDESLSPSATPFDHCTDQELRDALILTRLMSVSSSDLLQDPMAPQAKAYQWILSADPRQVGACDPSLVQRYILALLFFALDGVSWDRGSNWLAGTSECQWSDVVCQTETDEDDIAYDAVAELNFGHNNLKGVLPSEIAGLHFLQHLRLDSNNIDGRIPINIGGLSRLKSLDLYHNNMYGTIPQSLYTLDDLQVLDISSNKFNGALPSDLGQLSNLVFLAIANTTTSGTIPDSFASLTKLKNLILYSNNITGNIPSAMGQLDKLEYLDLRNNQLRGPLPDSIYDLTSLMTLYLGFNYISGPISSFIGNLVSLESLMLENNQFSGALPLEMTNLVNLETLNLTKNNFAGSLPQSMDNMVSLESVDLSNNEFSGVVPGEMFQVQSLESLYLSNNTFSGPISPSFQDFEGSHLYLDGNTLSGTLPDIAPDSLASLEEFLINRNDITGATSQNFCLLENLTDFWSDCSSAELSCPCCTECF